jgi:hypothetical protein
MDECIKEHAQKRHKTILSFFRLIQKDLSGKVEQEGTHPCNSLLRQNSFTRKLRTAISFISQTKDRRMPVSMRSSCPHRRRRERFKWNAHARTRRAGFFQVGGICRGNSCFDRLYLNVFSLTLIKQFT